MILLFHIKVRPSHNTRTLPSGSFGVLLGDHGMKGKVVSTMERIVDNITDIVPALYWRDYTCNSSGLLAALFSGEL